jgi:hypothetical protein
MTDVATQDQGDLSPQTTLVADAAEPHKSDLLEQFYLTLRVMYLGVPKLEASVVHERIERLFKGKQSWRNAYEIEQLLCFVLTDAQIETELERRLAEAKALKLEYLDVIAKGPGSGTTPPADKRFLLHRLLNDLQWFYSKRVQHRTAAKRLMWRSSLLFIVALVMLFLVLFIQFFAHVPSAAADPQPAATPAPVANPGV